MEEQPKETIPLLAGSHNKKALYNRLIVRLVPFFFLLGLLSFLDRTNISLAGSSFRHDLGLSQTEYGTGVSLFFVTYILFQIPSNSILKRLGTPTWVGGILLGWGITASAMAFAKTSMHFYILRSSHIQLLIKSCLQIILLIYILWSSFFIILICDGNAMSEKRGAICCELRAWNWPSQFNFL